MALMEPRAVARVRDQRGFTLVDLIFVLGLIGVLSALAMPGLTRARGAAQASSALSSLRTINSGQLSFAISCGLGFYSPDLPTLGVAPPGSTAPYLAADLSDAPTVIKSGYQFDMTGTSAPGAPPSCNGLAGGLGATSYKIGADPVDPRLSRYYGTNATGVLYQHSASLFAGMPEFGIPAVGQIVQ